MKADIEFHWEHEQENSFNDNTEIVLYTINTSII